MEAEWQANRAALRELLHTRPDLTPIPFRNLTSNIEIIGRNYQLLSSEAAETAPDIHS